MDDGPSTSNYLVLIADIVGSTKLIETERSLSQDRLVQMLEKMQEKYATAVRSDFAVTAGDEFQVMIATASAIPEMVWDIAAGLEPLKLRMGIGFGPVFTRPSEDPRLMDGPVFHFAREALNRTEVGETVFSGFGGLEDAVLNGLSSLMSEYRRRLSPARREVLTAMRTSESQKDVAEALDMPKQTVSYNVRESGWASYLKAEEGLKSALELFVRGANQ